MIPNQSLCFQYRLYYIVVISQVHNGVSKLTCDEVNNHVSKSIIFPKYVSNITITGESIWFSVILICEILQSKNSNDFTYYE